MRTEVAADNVVSSHSEVWDNLRGSESPVSALLTHCCWNKRKQMLTKRLSQKRKKYLAEKERSGQGYESEDVCMH